MEVKMFPLGMRSMNKRGRLIAERIAWADEIDDEANEKFQHFAETILQEPLSESIDNGRLYLVYIRDAIHGDMDPGMVDPDQSGEWMKSMRDLEALAVQLQAPPIKEWLRQPEAAELVAFEARGY